jgi:hypothetical protein
LDGPVGGWAGRVARGFMNISSGVVRSSGIMNAARFSADTSSVVRAYRRLLLDFSQRQFEKVFSFFAISHARPLLFPCVTHASDILKCCCKTAIFVIKLTFCVAGCRFLSWKSLIVLANAGFFMIFAALLLHAANGMSIATRHGQS